MLHTGSYLSAQLLLDLLTIKAALASVALTLGRAKAQRDRPLSPWHPNQAEERREGPFLEVCTKYLSPPLNSQHWTTTIRGWIRWIQIKNTYTVTCTLFH